MIVYEQGRAAYIDEFMIDDNPYDRESDYDSFCDWHYGWITSQNEARIKKMNENKCKYHKGDKVTVEGTVIGDSSMLIIDVNGSHVNIDESKILSHTPAPIKVGDKVRILSNEYTYKLLADLENRKVRILSGATTYEVLAVLDYRYVWLSASRTGEPFTVDIRNVERV